MKLNIDMDSDESHLRKLNELVEECTQLHMHLQRKEQLPRKFTDEDRSRLKIFQGDLKNLMEEMGISGERFLKDLMNSPFVVHTKGDQINTRDLRRCLQLLVAFRNTHTP
jgi:hypothetical protein